MEEILSIQKVSVMLGVTVKTLKIWDDESKLKASFRTVGGHRRYRLTDVEEFIGRTKSDKERIFIYCRVSTKKQEESGNLNRQEERLLNYCKEKGYDVVDVYQRSGVRHQR